MGSDSLFRNRNFLLLWIGYFINLVGSSIYRLAILWWTLQKTGQGLKLGILLTVSILPTILLAPIAGVCVDRWNRRNTMVVFYFLNSLIVIFVAVLDFHHVLRLWHLYLASAILSCLFAFLSASNLAILPQIVPKERLVQASSLQEFSMHSSTIVGAVLGGGLVGMVGTSGAFLINGLLTLLFSLLVLFIHISRRTPIKEGHWLAQMREGFGYLREERTLLGIMATFALINLAAFPIFILLPIFADRIFLVGPEGLGWMEGAAGLGAIAAVLVLFRFSKKHGRYAILQSSVSAIGILFVLAGFSVPFGIFLFFLSAMGFCLGLINIQVFSLFQIRVPEALLGRVMSLLNMILLSLQPIAFGLGGYLGDHLGARPMMMVCGLGILMGAALFALIPHIRKI